MQYLLTQEEYDSLISREKAQEIRNGLLDAIETLNAKVMVISDSVCTQNYTSSRSVSFYCDNCPIGAFGTKTCMKKQQYSK